MSAFLAWATRGPLFGIASTLLAYQAARWLFARYKHPLLHPVLIASALLIACFSTANISYERYFEGASFLHFLLGPATVALALPLYENARLVRRLWFPFALALLAGCLTAALSTIGLALSFDLEPAVLASLAPKAATTPVAMGIAEQVGGIPSLAAAFVIATGLIGASLGPWWLRVLGVTDDAARGIALGVAAHGIGTARALELSQSAGAFSSLAMGANAVCTAILVPLLLRH